MAEVSDKDVQRAREKVDRLRAQKAELEATVASNAASSENEYRVSVLDQEAARLQAEVDQLKTLAKPKTQSTVTDALVDQVEAGAPVVSDASAVLPEREK